MWEKNYGKTNLEKYEQMKDKRITAGIGKKNYSLNTCVQ